jgi:hypothetical protein
MKRQKVHVLSVTDGSMWWVYGVYASYGTASADAREYCDRERYGEERNYKIEELEVIVG